MAQLKFSHFYVILTETKYITENIGNVSYTDFTKKMIKSKKAYSTDYEIEPNNFVSRKVVFPKLSFLELIEFDFCTYEANSMGSVTLEYGWLPAISLGYFDYYNNQNTNLYVSPIIEVYGTDNFEYVRENKVCQDYLKQVEIDIFDLLENDSFDDLENYLDDLEPLSFDPMQLELKL